MKKHQIILIILAIVAVFLLVYSPHFNYPFPYHVDEWHHLDQAKRIINGEYERGQGSLEIGFQIFLAGLWILSDAVLNLPLFQGDDGEDLKKIPPSLFQGGGQGEVLDFRPLPIPPLRTRGGGLVLFYKFLPALWAVFGALALFWTTRQLTRNFYIALLTIIFFASIKSNVNITGLWFFTPLTFAIPFIFLYIYFLVEGINRQKKKFILIGLTIMAFLLLFHAVSVLFSLPILLIYLLINWRYLIKEWKFFLFFLIIPIIGVLFYKFSFNLPWQELVGKLLEQIQFKRGWGVLELNNPLTEIYSAVGFILAIIGAVSIIVEKKTKKYLFYLLWPIVMLFWIIIYRVNGVSFFSPHQRNLYYLALGLPLLSAIGLFYLITHCRILFDKINFPPLPSFRRKPESRLSKILLPISFWVSIILIAVVTFFTFKNYYQVPRQLSLYRVIDERDYVDLKYLATLPKGDAIAQPTIGTAMYSISGHEPFANLTFKSGAAREVAEKFFSEYNCEWKKAIIDYLKTKYVVAPQKIDCGWKLIYQEKNLIYSP